MRRRAGQRSEAREVLRAGLDLAHRCGADGLGARATEELAACGARPRRMLLTGPESLTAAERRVATLAGRGMSNPEIAQALYVSRKTVETQLASVYRKLDINSRGQLPAALSEPMPAAH
jgi:DNA-binding CsgD family transcriptional regulator